MTKAKARTPSHRRVTSKREALDVGEELSNWRKWRLPAGLVVGALFGLSLGAWQVYGYAQQLRQAADERYLLTQNYRLDRLTDQERELERDRRSVNAQVLELQSKQRYSPRTFSRGDRDILRLRESQLKEIDRSIRDVQEKRRTLK